eukprot:CAMPEP_0179204722 /NCGR_PEP_ID=MMETSP0796-20121207/102059_1 /TAXON_ID=73915 /ORGANISM="Pyrodinium bahamense, Strain pbaha01" /LENGTH=210 /DNA_ID=CAMNT_0020909607 /DNA_START=59 /DNA_END=691 /DNA_ORIENTATION=+
MAAASCGHHSSATLADMDSVTGCRPRLSRQSREWRRDGRSSHRATGQRAALRAGTHQRGIFQVYDAVIEAPQCDCACCIVEARRPSEAGGQALPKCAAPPPGEARCSSTRCAAVGSPVLANADVAELDRFCFYSCRPQGDLRPFEKARLDAQPGSAFRGGFVTETQCALIPHELLSGAIDSDGNGRDAQVSVEEPAGSGSATAGMLDEQE